MIDFDIVMLVPGMPFDGNTLKEHSLGGSESAALYMAQALARKGQHVTVFCNTDTANQDEFGVRYIPAEAFASYARATPHDVLIAQRMPEAFANVYPSKLNMMWCHDLALGRSAEKFKSTLWNVDGVMVLSDFMAEQYKKVYGIPESVLFRTRNGIDPSAFPGRPVEAPSNKRIMYCARPERGLDILLRDIMPKVWEREPDAQLLIATYDNPVSHLQPFYNSLRKLSEAYEDKVVWLGPLTKARLYAELSEARVYAYPTPSPMAKSFSEVSCIAAMEAQKAGLPIVTSLRGALPETIAVGAGELIHGDPWTVEYQEEFATAVVDYLQDDALWHRASTRGLIYSANLSWDAVAGDWIDRFESMIRERNMDDERLVRHAWRNSDIMLAKQVVDEGKTSSETAALLAPFKFAFGEPDDFRKHYEQIPEEIPMTKELAENMGGNIRYQVMKEFVADNTDEITNILDYGCAFGEYTVGLARDIPSVKTVGVDIDHNRVKLVKELAELAGVQDRVKAQTGDVAAGLPLPSYPTGYDLVHIGEVLEHVAEPWALTDAVERELADGGWMYITVPFGPWEYASYFTYPHRCHIWHFDMHDLRDMFGDKADLQIEALHAGVSDQLGTTIGWWVIKYRKNGMPCRKIDMERKRWLQRPRQTVSVSIMAGGNCEETLHWCARSFKHVADELIVVDCGMTDEAVRIAEQYNAFIVPGVDPKVEGFEVPRNIGIGYCRMDWVFWIDTDEKLINELNVHKYLRQNMFNGYGIRQHHFACDTTFNPDMPVRFFRNDGSMRFYGMIHEHPELGLNEGPGNVIVLADAHIAHVGYLIEGTRQARFVRNYPLLLKDQEVYPDRLLQKHFMMRDNILICRYELEHNGGRVTADIERRCQEVVHLFQQYFKGKKVYMGADSLQYYSDALTILGEGSEVAFQFDASREAANPGAGAMRYRFASKEDFVAEMTKRVEERFAVLEDPYY